MEDLWEKVTGWLVAAFILVCSAFMALWQRREKREVADLRKWSKDLQMLANENKRTLTEHETRLRVHDVHIDGVKQDLEEIKTSIGGLHSRISAGDQKLSDKLDRLLERKNHGL